MSMQKLHGAKPSSVGHRTNEKPGATRSPTIGHLAQQNDAPLSNIAVVDPRGLLRECLMRFMVNHRNFAAIGYPSVEDMMNRKKAKDPKLVILYSATQASQTALDEISRLKREYSSSPIVVLVETSDHGSVRKLLQQGVRGVVPTTFPANVVLEVINFVLSGGTFAPAESLLGMQQGNTPRSDANGFGLTNREGQIVSLLRAGRPNKQIAYELGLSVGTVKVHLCNIMKKLGTHNRVRALAHLSLDAAVGQ